MSFTYPDFNHPVDYSQSNNWMHLCTHPNKPVDIFYLYPTAYFKTTHGPLICETNHPAMRTRSQEHVRTKGSAFEPVGNYFVPYYRQACVECIISKTKECQKLLAQGPIASTLAAFDYYIKHLNQGRPFILAGHSQGSLMLQFILSIYMKTHPDVLKRMIAAYVIGFSVTRSWLQSNPHLKFATGRLDTGVIISYNTEAPNTTATNITLLPDALCINPISWTTTEQLASSSESLGAQLILRDTKGILQEIRCVPHLADAQIDQKRGVVVCSTVDPADFRVVGAEDIFPLGVMHSADYQLYYYDLRQNALDRSKAFLNK